MKSCWVVTICLHRNKVLQSKHNEINRRVKFHVRETARLHCTKVPDRKIYPDNVYETRQIAL